jgi:hypothetical protein
MPFLKRCIKPLSAVAILVLVLLAWPVSAEQAAEPDATHASMNGISYDTFGDFFKKWHFVTARYRKDTEEMRFTYANDIAWRALQEGAGPPGAVKDYPEGAAFGKVGVMTQDDPAFTSSAVEGVLNEV